MQQWFARHKTGSTKFPHLGQFNTGINTAARKNQEYFSSNITSTAFPSCAANIHCYADLSSKDSCLLIFQYSEKEIVELHPFGWPIHVLRQGESSWPMQQSALFLKPSPLPMPIYGQPISQPKSGIAVSPDLANCVPGHGTVTSLTSVNEMCRQSWVNPFISLTKAINSWPITGIAHGAACSEFSKKCIVKKIISTFTFRIS